MSKASAICYAAFSISGETVSVGVGRKAKGEGGRRERKTQSLQQVLRARELVWGSWVTLIGGTGGSKKSLHQSNKQRLATFASSGAVELGVNLLAIVERALCF